jgi:hypothetical protein
MTDAQRLAEILEHDEARFASRVTFRDAAAELRRLDALCKEWEAKAATWLASPEAAQRLDGYRELAQQVNGLEAECERLKVHAVTLAETARLVEQERCAKLCDMYSRLTLNDDRKTQCGMLAAEIRRGAIDAMGKEKA